MSWGIPRGWAVPPGPRWPSLALAGPLSVHPRYLLADILIGRAGQCLAAGPGSLTWQSCTVQTNRRSPSGRASPSACSKSSLLIKCINWHAACLFKEAVASAVSGSS